MLCVGGFLGNEYNGVTNLAGWGLAVPPFPL